MEKQTKRAIYVVIGIILFCLGTWVVPALPVISIELRWASCLSGLSLASWFLSIAMFVDWLKCGEDPKTFGIGLKIGALVVVCSAVVLYPPIFRVFSSSVDYASMRVPFGVIGYAMLTAFSGVVVYFLGLNSSKLKEEGRGDRDNTIRFLLSMTTLSSLVSIGIGFALSTSVFSQTMGASGVRAIVASSYGVLPVVAYSLGYLARQLDLPIARGLTFSLCVIFVLSMSGIAVSILSFNNFFFSAGITWFLIIGMFLGLFEKSGRSNNKGE